MINHVSIGVREIGRARRFYDAALGPLGYRCLSEGAESLGYGRDGIAPRARCRPTTNPVCISASARRPGRASMPFTPLR